MFSRTRFLLGVAAVLFGCASAARADVLFFTNAGAFQSTLQSLGMQDQNVLFNPTSAKVDLGPALTVTGGTNLSAALVNISSSENLTGFGGQSPGVHAQDGSFASATIAFKDPKSLIQSLFFNLNNVNGVTSTVELTGVDQDGNPLPIGSNTIDNGNNFFGVILTNGQALASATLTVLSSSSGGTDVLDQLNLIRISSVPANPPGEPGVGITAVPEPHSWVVWGLCVFALAAFGARRSMGRPVLA